MGLLKTELEKVKEEKEGFEFKIAKFEKSSKDLDALLASQVTDKSKKGFGYNVVPSPHPLILNRPTPLDLSYSGLEEFKQPEVNEYGPRDSSLKPTTVCDRESDNSKENTDDSLTQQPKIVTETSSVMSPLKVDKDWKEKFFHPANHIRVEEPKKARENTDAPIIEDWVSDDEEEVEPIPKVEKKTAVPTATKKESVKSVKPIRRSVSCPNAYKHMVPRAVLMKTGLKTVNNSKPVNTVRPSYTAHPKSTVHCARPKTHFQNQAQSTVQRPFYKKTALTKRSNNQNINTGRKTVNTVRPNVNTALILRPIKPNGASLVFNKYNYIDARGRSKSVMAWVPKVLYVYSVQQGFSEGCHHNLMMLHSKSVAVAQDKRSKNVTHDVSIVQDNSNDDQQVYTIPVPQVNTDSRRTKEVSKLLVSCLGRSNCKSEPPTVQAKNGMGSCRLPKGHRDIDDIIFGSTKKELCDEFEKLMKDKFQMSSMGELTFFLGLQVQQKKKGIFISQDKYVHEILKKFNYTDVKSASTPTDLEKPLVKDADADDVDEHLYRSMIGSLMYHNMHQTNIMFAVWA
ncbi:uncharacterized mitochondrial protein-like protein [Tanacetum coccineum]